MSDIELVIKIPEWKYKSICEGVEASKRCGVIGIDSYIHEAIAHGTPLPKGHGDLIDRSEVEKLDDKLCNTECGCCALNGCFYDEARTIIEADKGESEDKDSKENK